MPRRSLLRRRPWCAAAALALGVASPAAAQVAIEHATVIDVRTGRRLADHTVVADGDRIVAVGPARQVRVPRGAQRIDGRGRYVIPGLWDMHVHLTMAGRGALDAFLEQGVTGVRDMGGAPIVLAWRDSIAAGTLRGPRVHAAGTIIESARWIQAVVEMLRSRNAQATIAELLSRFGLATPDDAVRAADSLAAMRADFAKIRNYPPAGALFALFSALRRNGLALVGHAPPVAFVGTLSDSGMRTFEHSFLTSVNGRLVEGLSTLPDSARQSLFARLARNGTAWTPTFVSGEAREVADSAIVGMLADSMGARDARMRYVPSTLRAQWREALEMRAADRDTLTDWAAIERTAMTHARPMRDAGVPILAGTDLGVVTVVPGWSLHRELEVLVTRAGLAPLEALRAATLDAAASLGLAGRSGEVAVGSDADLVVLDADPLLDIGATRRIHAVMARGSRVMDRTR